MPSKLRLPVFHRPRSRPPHLSSPPPTPPREASVPPSSATTTASDAPPNSSSTRRPPPTLLSTDSSERDRMSVLSLFKEDYVSARVYMKELDYRQAMRRAVQRHMYKWYAILIIAIVLTALITAKHETVVEFCRPVTQKIRSWPAGWMVPIALLVVLSFPPLVGHEIVGILCGLVWGLWIGFAILAAGTFLGEIATWVAFKWLCQGRAAKFERKNKLYASLTQLIREKSFMFVLILRFSAVPGHITTAVSASAGANFWSYLAAAFLTLPKQWTIVYLGKAFGTKSRTNTIVSVICTVATLLGTVIAAVYIYYQMRIAMRRQALAALPGTADGDSSTVTMSEFTDEKREGGLHARRPWLFTNGSTSGPGGEGTGFRTPARSWSMPGHMNDEELREWVREIEEERRLANPSAAGGVGGVAGEGAPAIKVDGVTVLDTLPPAFSPPGSPTLRVPGTHTASTSGVSTPITSETDILVSGPSPSASLLDLNTTYPPAAPSPYRSAPSGRRTPSDTSTIGLESSSSPQRQPRGGREIADDADAYAISHGARRPDYRRMRGDSRAALLGRPVDDAALDMGGSGWKREYSLGRSRGDSAAALMGRPMLDELGRARGDSAATMMGRPTLEELGVSFGSVRSASGSGSWGREYGRSRGESGAALLGRPRDDDLGLAGSAAGSRSASHSRRGSAQEVVMELPELGGKGADEKV
ncbi:hypothetical protein IAT38_004823 [Cryptococcus sp. DSM 104549]